MSTPEHPEPLPAQAPADPFAVPSTPDTGSDIGSDIGSGTGTGTGGTTLRAPLHQVSPRAPLLWALGSLLGDLVLLAGLLALRHFDWFPLPWWVWVLYAVLLVVGVAVTPVVRYRLHRWESTESAVYTQTGWLSLERRIAPMAKVQTVDLEQGALARLLGLASVTVTTASAAGPVKIEAIDRATADRLVAELTRRAAAEAGDAT